MKTRTTITVEKVDGLEWGAKTAAAMSAVVLGQADSARLLACAAIAKEHVALVGPAGEGKTLLAEVMTRAAGLTSFYRLLSRYSTPEEVVGPWSLQALKDDRYERKLGGGALAEVVVLDEVFKANSPMLNALLGLLNERAVDGVATPLMTCIGLSNEWPRGLQAGKREGGDESLSPLWDRFLFRHEVRALDDETLFRQLIGGGGASPGEVGQVDGLAEAQALCSEREETFRFETEMIGALVDLRAALVVKGVHVSSRRWRKAVRALCASSVQRGAAAVGFDDLQILKAVLWDQPSQRGAVIEAIDDALPAEVRFLRAALEEARGVAATRGSTEQMTRAKMRMNALKSEVGALSCSGAPEGLEHLKKLERGLMEALAKSLGM